jgi:hypothetical protein
MNFFFNILVAFFLCASSCLCYANANTISNKELYKQVIQTLADDTMKGREVASIYETKAADYIKITLQKYLPAKIQTQEFDFFNPEINALQHSKNVYSYINNNAAKTILIGAHYDHIGLGGLKSLSYNSNGKVFNGADDNASGVAMAIVLAKDYKLWASKKYNYIFVFYSAHEVGLYGSTAFKSFAVNNFKPIYLAINFDMLGRLDEREKTLTIFGYDKFSSKNNFFLKQHPFLKFNISDKEKINHTDVALYYKSNIYSLSFTTGIHLYYHKITDDEKYINYQGLEAIQKTIEEFLSSITNNI